MPETDCGSTNTGHRYPRVLCILIYSMLEAIINYNLYKSDTNSQGVRECVENRETDEVQNLNLSLLGSLSSLIYNMNICICIYGWMKKDYCICICMDTGNLVIHTVRLKIELGYIWRKYTLEGKVGLEKRKHKVISTYICYGYDILR